MKRWLAGGLGLFGWLGAAAAAEIVVTIDGFSGGSGNLGVALYSSRMSYPEQPRYAEALPAGQGPWIFRFADLPTGDYVVLAWHDSNGNRELDRSMFGAPQEAYGYAGGARGNRVEWPDAAFSLGPETVELSITLER